MRSSPALSARRSTAAAAVVGLLAGLLAVLAPAVPIVSAPAASGASAYLCEGYSRCADNGYSHAGYASRSGRMYWRMYSGHNCTNYVAYRMIQAGMSTERPWSGSGNAYNWGLAMRKITDQRPAVGAVAWWNRNVPGAGSVGHVAYVERVVSPTVIIVSQDSWGGDFSWKRIEKNDRGWPSGFIHFRDRPVLVNATPPSVPGTPTVGTAVRASAGKWRPDGNTYTYQWLAGGRAVSGATTTSFTPTAAQLGKALSMRVTAKRTGSPAVTVTSPASPAVAAGTLTPTSAPVLSGDPVLGQTVTVTPGTYRQRGVTTSYTWSIDGVTQRDATGTTFVVPGGSAGKSITVQETATAPGYTAATAATEPLGPVVRGVVDELGPVALDGTPVYGSRLTVDPGPGAPDDATVTYQWMRDGAPIPDAALPTYRLRADDVGRSIAVRVVRARRYWRAVTTDHALAGPVTTVSRVRATVFGHVRAAGVVVRVGAPGVASPDGPVRVRVGPVLMDARVRDGMVRVVFPRVPPGQRRVSVGYLGNGLVGPGSWSGSVVIRR